MTVEQVPLERAASSRQSDRQDDRIGSSAWRLLHVENDEVDALKVTLELRYVMPTGSKIDHVAIFKRQPDNSRNSRTMRCWLVHR